MSTIDIRFFPFFCLFWWLIPYTHNVPQAAIAIKKKFRIYSRGLIHSALSSFLLLVLPDSFYPYVIAFSQSYFFIDFIVVEKNRFLICIHHLVSMIGIQGAIVYPYFSTQIINVYFWAEITNMISNTNSLLQFCNINNYSLFNLISYIIIRNIFGTYYFIELSYYLDCREERCIPTFLLFLNYSILYFGSLYWGFTTIRDFKKDKVFF